MFQDIKIRTALPPDYDAIVSIDDISQVKQNRRDFIRRTIEERSAYAAISGDSILGYGVLEYTFFESGYISILLVANMYRRNGVGSLLMRHMESICATEKLFTSTNLSNTPMQALLNKLGYEVSGFIDNLDEGDPELIYFKHQERNI
jgi:ribosomal protein S18 acetylase RimI-like enzyme